MDSERGRRVRVRFIKMTRCHLIPDIELIGYNAKGRGYLYKIWGLYTMVFILVGEKVI